MMPTGGGETPPPLPAPHGLVIRENGKPLDLQQQELKFHFDAEIVQVSLHGPGLERLEIVRDKNVRHERPLTNRVEAGGLSILRLREWDHAFAVKTSSATGAATMVAKT